MWIFDHYILSTLLLFLAYITYSVIIKPLNKMLYYRRQGVTHWKFFPVIGPMMIGYGTDAKKNRDPLHSERRLFLDGPKVPVRMENIFTQAFIILYDPVLIKEFLVT
jgi:hypothetical protein